MTSEREPDDDVVLCRCESVDRATVQAAIEAGAQTLNDVKRRTRLGMGICQGVFCLTLATDLLSASLAQDGASVPPMTSRPPVRQIALGDLTRALTGADQPE